jgi:hypothetical protein
MEQDRTKAFENAVRSIARNMPVLAFSRVLGIDNQFKMFLQTHTMIGAPKKRAESNEEKPLELLRDWLNKDPAGDVLGVPVATLEPEDAEDPEVPDPLDDLGDEEEEDDDAGG